MRLVAVPLQWEFGRRLGRTCVLEFLYAGSRIAVVAAPLHDGNGDDSWL